MGAAPLPAWLGRPLRRRRGRRPGPQPGPRRCRRHSRVSSALRRGRSTARPHTPPGEVGWPQRAWTMPVAVTTAHGVAAHASASRLPCSRLAGRAGAVGAGDAGSCQCCWSTPAPPHPNIRSVRITGAARSGSSPQQAMEAGCDDYGEGELDLVELAGGRAPATPTCSAFGTIVPPSAATLRVAVACAAYQLGRAGRGRVVGTLDFPPGRIRVSAGTRTEPAPKATPAAAGCGLRALARAGRSHWPHTRRRRP